MENVKNQKYVLTDETKVVEQPNGTEVVVHRIKCVNEFTDRWGHKVSKGTLGGFVENYKNLSQTDSAWIANDAVVFGNVKVCDRGDVACNAFVFADKQLPCIINGTICGWAHCFNTDVYDSSMIQDYAFVWNSVINDRVTIGGNAYVSECELNSAHFNKYLRVGFDKDFEYDISLCRVCYTNITYFDQFITEADVNNNKCKFTVETDYY